MFCAGLRRPQLYLSTGAVHALNPDELRAVIAHERHHMQARDPLRVLIARILGDALFFAVRPVGDRYAAMAELAADRAAVRRHGTRPLASALLAFEAADHAVVGIAPERVDQLAGDRPAWELPLALVAWTVIMLIAVAVAVLRLREAAGDTSPLNVPRFTVQLCMIAMAILPVLVGAGVPLASRRPPRPG